MKKSTITLLKEKKKKKKPPKDVWGKKPNNNKKTATCFANERNGKYKFHFLETNTKYMEM